MIVVGGGSGDEADVVTVMVVELIICSLDWSQSFSSPVTGLPNTMGMRVVHPPGHNC